LKNEAITEGKQRHANKLEEEADQLILILDVICDAPEDAHAGSEVTSRELL